MSLRGNGLKENVDRSYTRTYKVPVLSLIILSRCGARTGPRYSSVDQAFFSEIFVVEKAGSIRARRGITSTAVSH